MLLTTQYLEEADALADNIAVMDAGRVIAQGTANELKRVAGAQTIAVRPKDPGRLSEIAAIVGAVAGRAPDSLNRGLLTVPVEGDAAFTETVRRLDAAGIGVMELSLRLPRLDEVFLALTGHHTDEHEEGAV